MKPGPISFAILLVLAVTDMIGGLTPSVLGETLLRYTGLGFQHIIPDGLDHICFVLGLFFISRNVITLFWQVTVFTLAHSLTFGLALHGFVEAPAQLVEIAVALSIAFIAVENLLSVRLTKWRPWIVFGFGLIHGLAFAHTFRGHDVPVDHLMPAIFAFNMGIELGQITVITTALAVFGLFWKLPWYRRAVTIPASALIALAGLVWAAARAVA